MEAKAVAAEPETIAVHKPDLLQAWSTLERIVVSLRKIGSYYATQGPDGTISVKKRRQMLDELDEYFSPELLRELARARRVLAEYIPNEESETISERLAYWQPPSKD